MNTTVTHLYADGGCIKTNPSTLGATWAWCHTLTDLEHGWARKLGDWGYFTPSLFGPQACTNNVAELYAVLLGLEALPSGWSGTICSDSKLTLDRLATWTDPPGEAVGLRNVPPLLQHLVWWQVQRLNWRGMRYQHLGGHPTRADLQRGSKPSGAPVSTHNKWCDDHCKAAAERYWLDLHPDAHEVRRLEESAPEALRRIREDPSASLVPQVTVVKRSSQEVSLMARYASAVRPRRIHGITIGGSATSTLVTPS